MTEDEQEEGQPAQKEPRDQLTNGGDAKFLERLHFMEANLNESHELDKSIHRHRETLCRQMNDFLDAFEFMVINYGLEFRIESDKKSIEHLVFCAQHLLMERRFKNTERAYSKYGSKEQIAQLKHKRQEMERKGKNLKTRLEELKQQLQKLNRLDPTLRQEYRTLMSELECKRWALSNLKPVDPNESKWNVRRTLSRPQPAIPLIRDCLTKNDRFLHV